MESTITKIKDSKYIKSITILASGSLVAQIITILSSPIITRIYGPEELGTFTLMLTVVSMFAPVICGKYDSAIVIADNEDDVYSLIALGIILTIIFTVIISIGYKLYFLNNESTIEYMSYSIFFVTTILFVNGITNILTAYNNRFKQYKIISKVYVKRTLLQNLFQILLGILDFNIIGLIFSNIIGSLFGLREQSLYLSKNIKKFKSVTKEKLIRVFNGYKNQLIFSTPAIFMNSASYSIINFLISALFGVNIFGYYSLSYRMLGLPLNLISSNVSKVFFQNASEEYNNKGIYTRSLLIFSLILGGCAIPIVILMMILAPWLFKIFFGVRWIEAGEYVVILAPMYGLRLIVSALTPALTIVNKQKHEIIYQIMFMIASIFSYFVCKFINLDIRLFLILISILYSLIYTMLFYKIYKFSKGDKK